MMLTAMCRTNSQVVDGDWGVLFLRVRKYVINRNSGLVDARIIIARFFI